MERQNRRRKIKNNLTRTLTPASPLWNWLLPQGTPFLSQIDRIKDNLSQQNDLTAQSKSLRAWLMHPLEQGLQTINGDYEQIRKINQIIICWTSEKIRIKQYFIPTNSKRAAGWDRKNEGERLLWSLSCCTEGESTEGVNGYPQTNAWLISFLHYV